MPALGIGMRVTRFQIEGISADYSDNLKRWVRNAWPRGPRCFRWSIVSPSEPEAIELLLWLMAFTTCSVEGGGYFIVIGDLFVIKIYRVAGGNALLPSRHHGNEPEKTSGVLCALAGLYPSPLILSVIFCYRFDNLLVKISDYGVIGTLLSSLITLLDEDFGSFWQIVVWFSSRTHLVGMWSLEALSRIRRT